MQGMVAKLAGFEHLIKNALARHQAPDRQTRERTYNSARVALESMIKNSRVLDEESIAKQRKKLSAAIADIESAYDDSNDGTAVETTIPAGPPSAKEVSPHIRESSVPPQPSVTSSNIPQRPEKIQSDLQPLNAKPALAVASAKGSRDMNDIEIAKALKPRRSMGRILWLCVLTFATVLAVWWIVAKSQDTINLFGDSTTSNVLLTSSSNGGSLAEAEKWFLIYQGADIDAVVSEGDGSIEIKEEDRLSFLRISAGANSKVGNAIRIEIPPGIMNELNGVTATVELIVRSAGEKEQEFAVQCRFDGSDFCGRKRFTAGIQRETFLFDVNFKGRSAPELPGVGQLMLTPDIAATGYPLDLYSVRIKPLGKSSQ